ncbi:zinc finger protein 16-like [Dorcoceras hygrometricum]|uniref:Zinc finger protein 16-like n=1 Tax=Dorcoceras hygrometricum TaxID=472368 RepID=A0A2Z7BYW3_9LAMI|nr:zinc finger protein 16-like [Dorcoceras hygrometricum]
MGNEGDSGRGPIFRDIRRYYCQYCGIFRSKKSLISSHIKSQHPEETAERNEGKGDGKKLNICDECGASFIKPAHLKQHMQSHSVERSFTCPMDDCHSSYRRKDHLTRHLLQHQGKLFECPVEGCKVRFTVQSNMKRHVKEFHDDSDYHSAEFEHPKEYACPEPGCGKVFKYPCKLRKHENSHVRLDTVEALCSEPGCMKYFSNEQCLKEHLRSCHQYVLCDECGTKQLKKNIKRHLRMHEGVCTEQIKCSFSGCTSAFSTRSNLNQHIKAVHMELKPFTCSIPGCHMKFAFKHVRDNHEISGCHVYIPGNFEESDEQFRSRPRGGRKRKYPILESLLRKRVFPPNIEEITMNGDPE